MSKQIFAKIAKIGEEVRQAKAVKVELALIDDVKSVINQAESLMQEIDKDGKEFLRLEQIIQTKGNLLVTKIYDSLDSSVNKLDRSSKELGISIPEISKIQNVLNDIRGIRKIYSF
jgi:mevalonate kinase